MATVWYLTMAKRSWRDVLSWPPVLPITATPSGAVRVFPGSTVALIAGNRRELPSRRGGRQGDPDRRCRRLGNRFGGDARPVRRLGHHHRSSKHRSRTAAAPAPRSWIEDVRAPISGLGSGWRSVMCVKAPLLFHHMPAAFRTTGGPKHLGPAPGWVPREYVEQHVAMKLGATITGAREVAGRAELMRARLRTASRDCRRFDHRGDRIPTGSPPA